MEDIEHYDIPIYNFPYDVEEDDEDTIQDNMELRSLLPFAVVGSEEEVEIDGEPVRARIYPWGIVEVDNPNHSDFVRLRGAILGSHLGDLKTLTEDVLYETYRTEKLSRAVSADNRFVITLVSGPLNLIHGLNLVILNCFPRIWPVKVSVSRRSSSAVRRRRQVPFH